jgi:hypothetical protein
MAENVCTLKVTCLHPEAVKPPAFVSCRTASSQATVSTPDKVKANLDAWIEARKELTTKTENMSHQPGGRGCLSTLAAIDNDWVMNYNNYVSLSNNLSYNANHSGNAMQSVEEQMFQVLKRIKEAPTYCY